MTWTISDQLASYTDEGQVIMWSRINKRLDWSTYRSIDVKSWRWLFNVMAEHVD